MRNRPNDASQTTARTVQATPYPYIGYQGAMTTRADPIQQDTQAIVPESVDEADFAPNIDQDGMCPLYSLL